jgi:hypothetical protein
MLEGSCLCGGVRYEAEGPLRAIARCHCVQCRKASGAEFATNATVPLATFRVTQGNELLSEFESSPGRFRVFCGRCGSALFKRDTARPSEVRLRLGCLDTELEGLQPIGHIFVRSKPKWSPICDGLPEFETAPGAKG